MYSGTTLTRYSGRILGAHQKVDRFARRHLTTLLDDDALFPGIKLILHFEGKNGPDAIKRKSPARDEPWHYYSPFNRDDSKLIDLIKDHYTQLVRQLKRNNTERVAFEAAWLAHAIVDGLTPAHHYPYEEKLTELRGGKGIEDRVSIKKKLIIPGVTAREIVKNNWKMWGPKGLFSTHAFFEMGTAMLFLPLTFNDALPTKLDIEQLKKLGIIEIFQNTAKEIAVLDLYDIYYKRGWTPRLGNKVRKVLGPSLVRTVTLAWYSALIDSGLIKPE